MMNMIPNEVIINKQAIVTQMILWYSVYHVYSTNTRLSRCHVVPEFCWLPWLAEAACASARSVQIYVYGGHNC